MNNATVIKPRQYQLDAVNSIFNYWSNNGNKGNPCIVMPVGSGKSLTMAHFVKTCFDKFGSKMSKILIMTHVKELIEQDYQAVIDYWNGADIGIYSASLKSKNVKNKIVCCGVQSVANSYTDFGKVNCLVIDIRQ